MAFPTDLRQKMINLMYLVLMAMLAINIDPAALQGYKTINDGMEYSYKAFKSSNDGRVNAISAKAKEEGKPEQKKIDSLSQVLHGVSSGLDTQIDNLISQVRDSASGGTYDPEKYSADSKDPADEIMITNDISTGGASKLKTQITTLLSNYNDIVNQSPLEDSVKTKLLSSYALKIPSDEDAKNDPDNGDGLGWAQWTFQGKPAIAIEAILNQIKNDAKATEGQILEKFAAKMDANKIDIPYDTYNLAFVPSSTYMAEGEPFKAKLSVGQSSSKASDLVKIFVDGRQLPLDGDGFANYTATRGVGEYSVNAYAEVTNPQTGEKTKVSLETPVKYRVVKPSATVSADAMNVFYVGLDNPVSVSATGMDDAKAACSGCTSFSRSGAGYNAKVPASMAGKEVTVTVTSGGKTVSSSKFRVLKVPDPQVMIGNRKPGSGISTAELAAQGALRANLDNFPYDAKFQVVSFDLAMMKSGKGAFTAKSNGPRFSPQMKNAFQRAGGGWLLVCRNIKVKGPDGEVRDVGSITYITK